jgi:hypothetical protein
VRAASWHHDRPSADPAGHSSYQAPRKIECKVNKLPLNVRRIHYTVIKSKHHIKTGTLVILQGWKKPGFLKKKTSPVGFFGFFGFFWVFLGFLGFFGFFWDFLGRREGFQGFFQFHEYF